MLKNNKIYKNSIKWKNEYCDVLHCETSNFLDIPLDLIEKVHGVCFENGKMLIVYHEGWGIWGIPGGTIEKGETPIQTLEREIKEETACLLIHAKPFAYQEIVHSDGSKYYALFYLCDVENSGEFEGDVAGTITKSELIDPENFRQYIEDKPFRQAVIESAFL